MNDYKLFYEVTPKDRMNNTPGKFLTKPQIVDVVEYDGKELKSPERMLYFRIPQPLDYPFDLNVGLANYKFRFANKHEIEKICRYLMNNGNEETQTEPKNVLDKELRDIITDRMTLMGLMMTPFKVEHQVKSDWTILATKYKNKLYLTKGININSAHAARPLENAELTHHFKFKQYCFCDDPHGTPDTATPIYEDRQISLIYRSRQDNLNLLYSGEIDGLISDKKIDDLTNLEELNRCRFVQTRLLYTNVDKWWKNFRMTSWWTKCYLSGVNDIYMGRKSSEGVVRDDLTHVVVNRLPQNRHWSPAAYLNFMNMFINKVYDEMNEVDCPYTCYEFRCDSKTGCINLKIHKEKSVKSFLTDDFLEFLNKSEVI